MNRNGPGAVRINVLGRVSKDIFVSAFRNKGSNEMVIVVII